MLQEIRAYSMHVPMPLLLGRSLLSPWKQNIIIAKFASLILGNHNTPLYLQSGVVGKKGLGEKRHGYVGTLERTCNSSECSNVLAEFFNCPTFSRTSLTNILTTPSVPGDHFAKESTTEGRPNFKTVHHPTYVCCNIVGSPSCGEVCLGRVLSFESSISVTSQKSHSRVSYSSMKFSNNARFLVRHPSISHQ
jgi:hypothetical protein